MGQCYLFILPSTDKKKIHLKMSKLFHFQEARPKRITEFDHLTLNPILLTERQMFRMVDTLTERLTDPIEHGPIPVIYRVV